MLASLHASKKGQFLQMDLKKQGTSRISLRFEPVTNQMRHKNERRTNVQKIANAVLERQSQKSFSGSGRINGLHPSKFVGLKPLRNGSQIGTNHADADDPC